jgi:hypothetical protein
LALRGVSSGVGVHDRRAVGFESVQSCGYSQMSRRSPMPAVLTLPESTPAVRVHPPSVYVSVEWQYRHIGRPLAEGPPPDEELTALGREGWELTGSYADGTTAHLYFKRPAA